MAGGSSMPRMKSPVVSVSSDDDDTDEGNLDDDELESEFSSEDEGDDSEFDDQEYDEEEEDDVDSCDEECSDNDDELCDGVVRLHQGSNGSQVLSLNECKAYLRKHGLRLSGTKEECIQRIQEHQRLKDGSGESLYPRSSFSINCTGDACKGDVVLFTQKVYQKFDKATKQGNLLGKRTVAGMIVKESYGAEKQQHTFTVEVLWSKGFQKLPPLSTLLVKGRNLYRFRTLRQPWKSEAERSKVLGEKHKRGEAARHKRRLKKTRVASNMNEGRKRQKLTHGAESQKKQGSTNTRKASIRARKRKTSRFQETEVKRPTQKPAFPSNPNPSKRSANHLHEAYDRPSSSFMQHLPPNLPPVGFFPVYSHYNNGQARPARTLYHLPGRYNHEQPRHRLG